VYSQILNHIEGDLVPLKYPFDLEDLLEPTKEVIIAFIYRAENGNNVFRSRTLPHGEFE
jgi:hypothetical protein